MWKRMKIPIKLYNLMNQMWFTDTGCWSNKWNLKYKLKNGNNQNINQSTIILKIQAGPI